ncbi:beta-ketoacyl synthase N-terminal-like domain-containing protein, partial [Streptomyces alboverticillatus]|uniref:beta-ketoacyl synthase N-terminal-like domain-containing protein n=1 Tax=Streptomyces alboverticillatus TaxID=173770 RepID=UPI002481D54B
MRMGDDREVLVTGLGAITPLGAGVEAMWEGMLAGESGVGRLGEEWPADLPVRVAEDGSCRSVVAAGARGGP